MTVKYLLIFALCFLVGATAAIAVRSAVHQPYAPASEAPVMSAPAPADSAPSAPAPAPGHQGHGATPAPATNQAKPASADVTAIGNTICPSCGMDVDPELLPITTAQGSIGIGCAPCAPKIARDPGRYADAARDNKRAK